jgi:pyruvate-formate lyase-activating enzyme
MTNVMGTHGSSRQRYAMESHLERIASTLRPFDFPSRFAVEVCSECNLACAMCHHPQMRRPKGRMPMALWHKCADEVAAVSPRTECWFSFIGEPLLEPDLLFDMLDYGQRAGLRSMNVNTNGMLLTRNVADRLLESAANTVVLGIDGFTAPVYERVRIGGIRDVVYENVEYLVLARQARASGPEVMVQFIEMDENRHEMEEFRHHWLERGATVKLRNQLSWGGKFDTSLCVPPEARIPCPWACTMMHVFWDGRVPRCPGDTEGEEGVGNAWDESLTDLWGRLDPYRALHLNRRFDELPDRCQACKDWMTGAAAKIAPIEGDGKAEVVQ